MTQFLPPNLLALFAARDPIPYLPPVDKLSWEKKTDGYSGIASLMSRFEDPEETPPPVKVETKEERLERKRKEKAEQMQYKLEQEIALWEPHNLETATSDPYKTLFIARINYDTSESKLRREFEIYGPIKKIVIVHNKISGKPRGYAFIEYEHERDMHSAYKHADGKKIDNRRVLVDVERARTVKGWLPRRLGGGLGGTRKGGPDVNVKHSGRDDDRKRRDEDGIPRDRERERERGGGVEREMRVRERDRDRGGERDRDRGGERRHRPRRPSPNEAIVDNMRERKRRRSRSRERGGAPEEEDNRRRRRSKSKERRRRSRSKEKEKKHRRERDRERERNRVEADTGLESTKIKQEPDDDYPDYPAAPIGGVGGGGGVYNNFPLKEETERLKNGTTKYEEELDY